MCPSELIELKAAFLGRIFINPARERGSLNVRFTPKPTNVVRQRNVSRWAMNGLVHRRIITRKERPPCSGLSEIRWIRLMIALF